MENKFLSFALEEERSTYTEGESRSRRSSILKPPKVRAPLQEVNLGGSADDTEDFDTLRKRRVSFAGVNSVKEFCSQAESLQVFHIQSYEETFSTSSDNSQNNSAKSLLQSATKNAAPTGEDHNFADDPMDLTDSMIDNNHAANKSATGSIVQVVPVFTPSAQLAESGMDNRGNLASWSGRKSLAQRTAIDSNMTSSNMSMSSVVGGPPLGTPRNPGAPIGVSSPWSCSMEMTEPVHVQQNRLPNQEKNSIFPIRNSFKAAEQSDHGMELTEAIPVKIRPFSINQVNDNVGDMSMEMTEMVKKTELQSFRSRMSSSNKSASMEFTEVVHTQRKSTQFQNFHLSGTESLSGNGMELTEPLQEHFKRSDPSERLLASGKLNSVPQAHHVTPFPHVVENRVHDYDKSLADTSGNNSLCDMEMTGVLSLSKYNKMVPQDDDDDMEFTQMLSVNGPKKPRLSNEPDEEPFHIISPLSTKVCDVQQPSHQHKASRQSIPASLGQDQSNMAVPLASNKDSVPAANQFDDDDTFALNFKNIKREDEPIELSFLKEFRDSPKIDKTEARVIPRQSFASTQNAEPLFASTQNAVILNHEHFLNYSPPKHSKPDSEMNEDTDFWRMSSPKEPLSIKKSVDDLQPIPTNSNIQKKCSMNFETNTLREHQNMETDDPLRNMRNSRSFAVDTSLAARSRVSFKDFEIKPDSVVVNESLSTVGLDDSDILKAGLNDMTCPEGVPSICMSMTDVTSPCSKSRMSLADKNTLLNSSTQEIQQCEHPTLVKSFQPDFGGVKPRTDHLDAHDEDTSVSVPFVFKSLPEKRKSEAPKLGQSFPVIEFDESPNRPGVSLPQRTSVATNIPAAKKSIDPKKFYSNQEANDQDTSISVPFVFKAVTDASSNALKLRQSFPVIECGEGQSSAQMELTEVAQTVEPRKSLARTNLDFDGNSLQPSYSSGQMELTDVVAVNRKSISSANPTVSPQDTSGIEMDETLQKVKSCDEVKAPETLSSLSVGLTTTCDMEETNVKQKSTENPRKSFFSSNHSPLSLTSEETITKPITSSIACIGDTVSKSCVDDEETVAKSSLMNLEVSRKELSSSGVIDIDMEQTNVNHQIRVSVGHNKKKSFESTRDSVPVDVEQEIARKSTGIAVDVLADYQGELKSLDRKSEFFSAARLSCRKSGLGKGSDSVPVDVEQEIARKSTGITVDVAADYQGELKSLDRKSGFFSAARLSCRKSVLGKESDSVPAGDSNVEEILRMRVSLGKTNSNVQSESGVVDESTRVQIPPNNVEMDCLGEASCVNRKSGFFPSTARISRRESDFDPLEDSCNAKQSFVDKSLGTVAMDDVSENESIGVQILPNKANCISELKSSCVNRKSGVFSSGARISRQESDFDPLEDDSNVKQGLVNKSFGRVAMDDFENESIGVEIPPKNVEVDCLGELKSSCVYRKSGFFSSAGRISRQESDFDSLEVNSNVKQDVVGKSIGGVAMDDVAEDESAEVVIPQEGQYQGELKSLNVDRKSGLFSSAAKLSYRKSGFGHAADSEVSSAPASQDGSPLGRLSSRKSGLVASQPREVCDERDNDVIPSENTSMELTSPDAGAIDDKHESNAPLDMLKTEDLHEDRVPTTNMRLSRKSVRFINSPAKEDNDVRCHDITNPEVYVTPDSMSTDGCIELNSYGFEENENPLPRRASRKSCIGIPVVTDADEEENQKSTSDVQSGETEFAIRRNSRKSTIGARQSRIYIEFDSPSPEDCDKVDVTPTHAEERIPPVSESVDKEALNAAEDIDLSQNMMNISLNDGEFDESETGKLNATSTPCKPLASCSETQDRKRNRSGTARNPSLASDLVHDLSQEVMNISIQSDTRSPLPKKSSTGMRKSKGLSLKGEASCVELNLCETGSAEFENTGPLEYESRLANRELMKRLGFNLLGSQTCWETLLYDKVLGIKVVLPSTRFTEFTRIYSIEYTFYSWRIGRTLFLDRETVEFIRNRLHRHMPKEWLREKCNTIGDLFKTVSALKKEMEMLKPLIHQLSYVKSRRPCTISNDRISFKIVNLHAQVDCEVTVELKNSHKMSDCCITLKNNVGKLNLDTVRMVFQALPSSDVDVLFRFVKFLDSETSQLTLGA